MSFGDIVYVISAILFAIMTFLIVRGNFQRKFDDDGNRKDLVEKEEKDNHEQ